MAGAYWAARQVLGLGPLLGRVSAEAGRWSLEADQGARDAIYRAIGRLARWSLLHSGPQRANDLISADGAVAAVAEGLLPADAALQAALDASGVPGDVVADVMRAVPLSAVGELGSVARHSARPAADAALALAAVGQELEAGAVGRLVAGAQPADRWERRQAHLLGDDLARARVVAAGAALDAFPGLGATEAVAAYLAQRPRAVANYAALARQVDGPGPLNLSLVALSLRAMAVVGQEPAEE